MTERIAIRPLLGFVLLQVALFQLTLWAHLRGDHTGTVLFGSLTGAAVLGSLGYYWFATRPRSVEPARPAGRPSVMTPAPFQPTTGDQVRALILGTLGFVVSFMVWGSIAPISLHFKELYALTNTQVSLLIAVPVLLGSLGRLPVGMLADKFGPRQVYAALMAFLIFPLVLMGLTNSYASLLGVAFFVGAGGTSFAVGVPFVSRWFPASKQGLALGIFGMGNFGQALGVLYAPRMTDLLSWQYTYWVLILPVALTAAAIWFLGKDAPKPAMPAGAAQGRSIWVDNNAWLFSVFYFVTFGGFVAFGNYLPKLYAELHTMTTADAATYTAIFVLGATLSRPVGGWLSDLFGAVKVLILVFSVVILGGLGLATSPVLMPFNLLVVGLALSLGIGNGAVFKLVPEYFPGRTGAVTGMVGALGGLGGFFPPLVMGLLRDQVGSYTLGFVFLAATAVAALLGVLSLWNRPTAGEPKVVTPRV